MGHQGYGGQHHPTPPTSSALADVFQAQRFHHFSCKVCFYHCKFRNSARRCQDPCIWLKNDQAGLQQWAWQPTLKTASFLYGRGIPDASSSLTWGVFSATGMDTRPGCQAPFLQQPTAAQLRHTGCVPIHYIFLVPL